jgi:hypothetical protein
MWIKGDRARKGRIVLLAATGLALALPASASAATVIGQTGTPHGDIVMLPDNQAFVQSPTDPDDGAAVYRAPSRGVITSWSAMANASVNRTLKLLVLRFNGGDSYNVIARDGPRTLALTNQLNTFPVQIPIEAGDQIGNYSPDGQPAGLSSGLFTGVAGELVRTDDGEPGAVFTWDASNYASNRVNVAATLEPDADSDGFGDETQDQCPSLAATQGVCPVTAAAPVPQPKPKCKKPKRKKGKASASAKKKKGCKKKKKAK